jgi:hypothetical protein
VKRTLKSLLVGAFLALVAIVPSATTAAAQAPAAPDTGWVEIGGTAAPEADTSAPFGADDPFADLPVDEDASAKKIGGTLRPYLDYNRVDQWTAGLEMGYRPEAGFDPAMRLRIARAFQRKTAWGDGQVVYDLRVDQPLVRGRRVRVGLARYRKTDDDGFGQVGGMENALATAFFRRDYRDWFEKEGIEAGLAGEFGTRWSAAARWNSDIYASITELADGVGLAFRKGEPLRENPAIDDGRIQGFTFGLGYDSRSSVTQPRGGMRHRIEAETAGGSLGGDFAYHRYKGDFRVYLSPSPSHQFKTRVMAGTSGKGDVLPLQKTFAIGGIGTMRATPLRHLRGNRMLLWNADWAWEVLRRSSRNAAVKTGLSLVVFSDLGLAWDAPTWNPSEQQMGWNVGLGIGSTDENFRVYLGRDVRAEHAPLHCTVRLGRSY